MRAKPHRSPGGLRSVPGPERRAWSRTEAAPPAISLTRQPGPEAILVYGIAEGDVPPSAPITRDRYRLALESAVRSGLCIRGRHGDGPSTCLPPMSNPELTHAPPHPLKELVAAVPPDTVVEDPDLVEQYRFDRSNAAHAGRPLAVVRVVVHARSAGRTPLGQRAWRPRGDPGCGNRALRRLRCPRRVLSPCRPSACAGSRSTRRPAWPSPSPGR